MDNPFPSLLPIEEIKKSNVVSSKLSSYVPISNEISSEIKNQITLEENKDADFYYNRGNTKYFLEDYSGAIQDCNKAIELDPDNAGVFKLRGIANRKLKNNKDAIFDYSKAIELDPDDPQAYIFRCDAKFVLGDTKGGCFDLDKAGELCSALA